MERAIRFQNPQGQWLSGVLHLPDGGVAPGAPGVVWYAAGQKIRQGAWRMNVVIARRLAALGVPTLRFDFSGIGDSEGDHRHGAAVMDFYGFIQTGGYYEDALAGARFLQREAGVRRLVLAGLCGGAITGLFAAPLLGSDVVGQVLIDLPVTISSAARQRYLESNAAALLRSRPGESDTVLLLYLKKLGDPAAWRRLLSGQSDYKLQAELLRIKALAAAERAAAAVPEPLRSRVAPWISRVLSGSEPASPTTSAGSPGEPGETDHKVAAAMQASGEEKNAQVANLFQEAVTAGQRIHFLNSSAYHPTFLEYFGHEVLGRPMDEDRWRKRGVTLTVAADTNHIFSVETAQGALFSAVEQTVAGCFEGGRGAFVDGAHRRR